MYERVRSAIYHDDEGVSPVIAVILMVAITVVLAATVYVWVSGFASEDSGPEQASATARGFEKGGNDVNWIRVTLTKANNAPYDESDVSYTLLDPSGNSRTVLDQGDASTNDFLCTSAEKTGTDPETCQDGNEFYDDDSTTDTNSWDAGQTLYLPCQESGDHSVTISVKGTTILDSTVTCDAVAT